MNPAPGALPRLLLLTALLSSLAGCSSLLSEGSSAAAGVAGAAIANKVTDNATVATGIGLGVQAAARAGVQYAQRKTRGEEQDAIAQAAGLLAVGAVGPWRMEHQLPLEPDAQGRVTVSRLIGGFGLNCKEIIFSVEAKGKEVVQEFYMTTICDDDGVWRWAMAEPATARWGSLQ